MNVEGRVAIVTAAGRGLGRGIAIRLAEAGADVVVSSYSEETTSATAGAVEALGRRALRVPGDITRSENIRALIERTVETFGRIDILVNNVGAAPKEGIPRADDPLEQTGAVWDALYAQNLRPLVLMTEAVQPILEQQRSGRIVNISSIAGKASLSAPMLEHFVHPSYGAMKAAVAHYTRTCAELLGRHEITVNAVCPGIVYTDAWAENAKRAVKTLPEAKGLSPEEWFERFARGEYPEIYPAAALPRAQSVEDIANAVLFLASDAAASITGQSLMVDSGLL